LIEVAVAVMSASTLRTTSAATLPVATSRVYSRSVVYTVRHHVRSMYRKLHVCARAEAVTIAYRLV
jgi:hypothetical protein